MEHRVEELERKLGEMVLLLREHGPARRRGRSPPPRRGPHRVDSRDRWDGGSKRNRGFHHRSLHNEGGNSQHRERPPSSHSRSGLSSYRDFSSWGGRPPNTSHGSPSGRRRNIDRKMELPIFSGEDAPGWLLRIERYFSVNHIEGDERMELVLVALDGKALGWYRSWEEQAVFPSWRDFREALLRRFQPGMMKDPFGPLLRVRQLGSVLEYVEQFEQVSGPIKFVDPEMLKGIFVNGLRPEIQAEIKSLDLSSLTAIKDKALMLEDRNNAWRSSKLGPSDRFMGRGPNPHPNRGGPSSSKAWSGRNLPDPKPSDVTTPKPVPHFRRLSQEELQERSRKGLCFKCGERWGQDHVCTLKNFKLVLVEDAVDGSDGGIAPATMRILSLHQCSVFDSLSGV